MEPVEQYDMDIVFENKDQADAFQCWAHGKDFDQVCERACDMDLEVLVRGEVRKFRDVFKDVYDVSKTLEAMQ